MNVIKPFRGFRYDLSKAGELSELIAPPYDVISPDLQQKLHHRSIYNIVRLALAEDEEGDDEHHNKYTRAARRWREWRDDGVLFRDGTPMIYRYMMSFSSKMPEGIVTHERPGFMALLRLFEYSEGKVLPHERTLAGPKEDRFQLMLHTGAQFSPVFLIYPDEKGVIDSALGESPLTDDSFVCEDDAGVSHSLWPISDPEAAGAVEAHLSEQALYIADGHHRYETALTMRRHLLERSPLFAEGLDYVLAYFTPLEHPGLTIFPYHRLIHNLPKRRLSGLFKKLADYFHIDRTLLSPLQQGEPRREFMTGLRERGKNSRVFGMVDSTGQGHYLTLKTDVSATGDFHSEAELEQASLDVSILERVILKEILGIKHKDLTNEKHISYATDYDTILNEVQNPPYQLAFLLNPTPVEAVIRISHQGGVMPEKSTYFFPKTATGLVMRSMED
ncbi:MAG: DUF1015 domain-containing protein [bacterium]